MKFSDLVTEDLEIVMRRIEVQRVWETDWSEADYPFIADISIAFMQASQDLDDARYLNTALKLNDLLRLHWRDQLALDELAHKEDQAIVLLRTRIGLMS